MRRPVNHLGTRLRLLREVHGLTQRELGARAGVEHVTITRIERGQRAPREETVGFLAQALGCSERALTSDAAFVLELARVMGIAFEQVALEHGGGRAREAPPPADTGDEDRPVTRKELRALFALLGESPGEKSEPPRSEPAADGGGQGRGGRQASGKK